MQRIRHDGDEQDAFGPGRHHQRWKAGQRKRIKQAANRRERRNAKQNTQGW